MNDQHAPRAESQGTYERKCKHCGETFRTNNPRALYHSEECKKAAADQRYYERHKPEIIERVLRNRSDKQT